LGGKLVNSMHILNDMVGDYNLGTGYVMNMEDFASDDDNDKEVLLSWGINSMYRTELPPGYKRYILLEAEEPVGLQTGKLPHARHEVDELVTVPWRLDKWDVIAHSQSPSVTQYFNGVYETNKFVPILQPVHPKWHNPAAEKKYTVAYCGGTHECEHNRIGDRWKLRRFVHTLRKFPDSVHISQWPAIDGPTQTHSCIPDAEKMQILNETKISVIKNSHFGGYSEAARKLPNWDKYNWTSHIDENWVPQLKGRVSESCICKNLMLVHRDPWNEIEHFLTPDKHFIYFNDEADLENKIKDCLNNWDFVQHIAENAYKEYIRKWCTSAFYDRFIREHEKA